MYSPFVLTVLASSIAIANCVGPLVFEDNFTGPLNLSKWHVQSGVHIHGVYEAANAFTANNSLILRTVACNQTIDGVQYFLSSGAVDTSASFTQQWGTWEARVRMPNVNQTSGFRLHSSIWLFNSLPWISANGTSCGADRHPEVDLIEYDPVDWTRHNSSSGPWAEGHFHSYFDDCHSAWAPFTYARSGVNADFHSDFHLWSVTWTASELLMSVDGSVLLRVTDQHWLGGLKAPLYFLLTNAIMVAAPPTTADVLPLIMEVDYVRIYAQ
jgi:beta-glucanase (GH16 family)